jgi:fructose-1-phosphate kinase PfkB-like protein
MALLAALPAKPGLIKPNRVELAASVGRPLPDDAAVMDAMRELCQRGAQRCVITAGAAPVVAFDGRRFYRIRGATAPVVNPIGSGDAFCAALVWRLLRGDDLGEACRWATAAGTANAMTLMAGEVDPAQVERLVESTRIEPMAGS